MVRSEPKPYETTRYISIGKVGSGPEPYETTVSAVKHSAILLKIKWTYSARKELQYQQISIYRYVTNLPRNRYFNMKTDEIVLPFKKMLLKLSSGNLQPFCLGLNGLIYWHHLLHILTRTTILYGTRQHINTLIITFWFSLNGLNDSTSLFSHQLTPLATRIRWLLPKIINLDSYQPIQTSTPLQPST